LDKKRSAVYLSVWLLTVPLVATAKTDAPIATTPLQQILGRLPGSCQTTPPGLDEQARQRLQAFYLPFAFTPLWSDPRSLNNLVEELEKLADDGLDAAFYQPATLRRMSQNGGADPRWLACLDILASHAYLQALQHLVHGRLPQAQLEPMWRAQHTDEALTVQTLALLGVDDVQSAFEQARPALDQYQALRAAYVRMRDSPLPPWTPVPPGPLLRPGMQDSRVPALRSSLIQAGYLTSSVLELEKGGEGLRYQYALVDAVEDFQRQHALKVDGIVGPGTLDALNISPASRLDQLRVNLERWRWYARDMESQLLLVDIAGGQLSYYRNRMPVWQTRVQVGRAERATPQLKSMIERLTLNPTWTVPPTILREDKLPEIRRDIGFLARHQMRVFDQYGNRLNPYHVDWNNVRGLRLRQDAGPSNPLGKVAVRFANPFAVYLHDTPSQQLFSEAQRTFSSGCVRVEGALTLVDLLLSEGEHERVTALLETGRTHEYRLNRPLPILMAYWTAEVDASGRVLYRPDIYGRDPALRAALNAASPREQAGTHLPQR
jgi:murein L,D-transpeptidase YcbB/YkuD